jgi:hypothetical protein
MVYCCIVGCETGTRRKVVEKFQTFTLPESKGMKDKWLEKINRDIDNLPKFPVVCGKHFEESAFIPREQNLDTNGKEKKKKSLKSSAIPTLFLKPAGDEVATPRSKRAKKMAGVPVVIEQGPVDFGHSYNLPPEDEPEPLPINVPMLEEEEDNPQELPIEAPNAGKQSLVFGKVINVWERRTLKKQE